jgi:hypothetical protein
MARHTLRMRLSLAACLLLQVVAPGVLAQTIVATNSTDADPPGTTGTPMTISRNDDMVPLAPVLPLTTSATDEVPPTGLSGEIIDVGTDNQFVVKSGAVALISCDPSDYPGNIDAVGVFRSAVERNVAAVLFYSKQADYCRMDGDQSGYKWVFSMKSRDDTTNVLNAMANSSTPLWVTIGGPEAQQGRDGSSNGSSSGSNSNTRDNGPQGPLGPNPSTAVAMIILYTITGVITALFLVIIVTGAIRAHRHPERYGPRAIVGRPRQSRARGIGRAILDGIPIVKFGEREEPKPADVEMGTTSSAQENRQSSEPSTGNRSAGGANLDGAVDGIAAAGATSSANATEESGNQGCSICTEDFERGQDQRVLPCDHRFHPECIDPWLLNVSGTCPLCRVDLRPQRSHTSQDVDEHGNPIPRENNDDEIGDLPPPVAERSSVRRSLMIGILGIRGRPDRMTREERVMALRRYRQQQAARRRRESGNEVDGAADPQAAEVAEAQDRSTRQRLRNLLGVRTRRTGQDQTAAEVTDDAAGAGAGASGSGSADNATERR